MPVTTIDLIRHGEPEGGRAIRGHGVDDPLSELGWRQMWHAVGDYKPWQQVITSPLVRCRAFAEALGERHAIPVSIEPDFKEVGFGCWEGRTQREIRETEPEDFAAFYRDPVNCRPAGAEPLQTFVDRVVRSYARLVQTHAGQHLLVVGHAGVIRAILSHVLGTGPEAMYRFKVDNAGVSRIREEDAGPRLLFHNVTDLSPTSL